MEVSSEKNGKSVVVHVKGRMDVATAPQYEDECIKWIELGESLLVVDLAGLEYISSAGLRSLLVIAKRVKSENGDICFCNASEMVKEVFSFSGFSSMFAMCESLQEALSQF
jgi:anti-anti-sigma factor